MKNMKKLTVSAVALSMMAAVGFSVYADGLSKQITAYQNGEIKIAVNGKPVNLDSEDGPMYPIVYDGHSYVSAKALAEALGAKVSWNPETKTVEIVGGAGRGGDPSMPNKDNSGGQGQGPRGPEERRERFEDMKDRMEERREDRQERREDRQERREDRQERREDRRDGQPGPNPPGPNGGPGYGPGPNPPGPNGGPGHGPGPNPPGPNGGPGPNPPGPNGGPGPNGPAPSTNGSAQ